MELRLLGDVDVWGPDGQVPVGPAARTLLAGLLASRRRVVSLDHLADVLWGDHLPATSRPTLQTHLSRLRGALRPLEGVTLEHRPPGYVLLVDRSCVDADRFEDAIAAGRALAPHDGPGAVVAYDAALACWHGEALAGFADQPWARPEASRLDELHLLTAEERIDVLLAEGRHAEVVAELEAAAAANPLRERPRAQLMLALHRSGRQAEALRVAQALRRHLGEEAGLEPSPDLRELEQAIAVDDPDLRAPPRRPGASEGPPPTPSRKASAVPLPTTPLVGRDQDVTELRSQVARAGLVTLVGPGGVGKSALAYEVARTVGHLRQDGTRIVELAPVSDPTEVDAAVAAALGVEQRPGRSLQDSIVELLAPLDVLLVLDNCEHVLGAAGSLVARIVRWCPDVRVLATSRAPLGMPSESMRPVSPLPVPSDPTAGPDLLARNPAVQVFVARARAAAPGFRLDADNARAVADLCVALDGVPLGLELAAARMRSMSAPELRDRLQDRFTLLGQGPAVDVRHRTLFDLVQWSHELLTSAEQALLAELSVFAGGFTLGAAESTCGVGDRSPTEVVPLLAALVEQSMVVAEPHDRSLRYRQLETIRQFGADRLDERPDASRVRAAHRATFTELAELTDAGLDGPDEGTLAARLAREWANLRGSVRSAVADGDADTGLRLVVAAREASFRQVRYELVRWVEELIELPDAQEHPLLPTAIAVTAYGAFVRGELRRSIDRAERALGARVRLDQPADGLAERALGNALFYQGDLRSGQRWMDRMVEAALASGSDGRIAHACYMRSVALTSVGDPIPAEDMAGRSLDAARRAGSPTARSQASYAAGLARATRGGDTCVDEAVAMLDESAQLAASAGNRWMEAFALTEAMWLRSRRGETEVALAGYRGVVETWFQSGDWANQWLSLRQLAGILASVGRDEDAALLFGAVNTAGAGAAMPLAPNDAADLEQLGAHLEARLGPEQLGAHRRRGAMMRDEAVVATALAAIDDLLGAGR